MKTKKLILDERTIEVLISHLKMASEIDAQKKTLSVHRKGFKLKWDGEWLSYRHEVCPCHTPKEKTK